MVGDPAAIRKSLLSKQSFPWQNSIESVADCQCTEAAIGDRIPLHGTAAFRCIQLLAEAWPDSAIVPQLVALLPWGHLRVLLDRLI